MSYSFKNTFRALIVVGACGSLLSSGACFRLPPELPDNYVGSLPEAPWPPLAVYHDDPYHEANLFFHRIYSLNQEAISGDVPIIDLNRLTAIDALELDAALMTWIDSFTNAQEEGVGVGGSLRELEPRGLRLFYDDLRWIAHSFERFEFDNQEALMKTMSRIAILGNAIEKSNLKLADKPVKPKGHESAMKKIQGVDPHPLPLRPELMSWEASIGTSLYSVVIHQLQREAWRRGDDAPWRSITLDSPVYKEEDGRLKLSTVVEACGRCH